MEKVFFILRRGLTVVYEYFYAIHTLNIYGSKTQVLSFTHQLMQNRRISLWKEILKNLKIKIQNQKSDRDTGVVVRE